MSNETQPYQGISEFALPGEMRELIVRIFLDLINPCRQRLQHIEQHRRKALDSAEHALAKARAELEAATSAAETNSRGEFDRVNALHCRVTAIREKAGAFLKSQGVIVDSLPPIPSAMNKPEGQAREIDWTLQVATESVPQFESRLQQILNSKPIPYWPESGGWRGLIVIMSFCWGIGLLWFPFVLLSRLIRSSMLKSNYLELMKLCQPLSEALQGLERQIKSQTEADIKAAEERLLRPAERAYKAAVEAAEKELGTKLEAMREAFLPTAQKLHGEVAGFWKSSLYAGAEWFSADWENWFPDPSPEFAARIGTFTIRADDLSTRLPGLDFTFRLPALVPFDGGQCLLLEATGAAKNVAVPALQSVMLRMMANTPPGKLRFTFIDPVGLGQNVADYMALADHEEALISGKAWTESRHIETRLAELSDHMETVIQKYLRNDFASITDYNKKAQDVAEPFRFLVVFDFPVNFSDEAARRLVSIVKNGPRCGVYTLILRDTAKPLPHGFNIADLEVTATRITSNGHESPSKAGVSAKRPDGPSAAAPKATSTSAAAAVDAAITFDLILESTPADKIDAVAGIIRQLNAGLSPERAVNVQGGDAVLTGVGWPDAERAKKKFQDLGAQARIRIKIPRAEPSRGNGSADGLTGCFVWKDKDFQDCALHLDQPPPKPLFKYIVAESGTEAKQKMKVEVAFEKLLALADLNEGKWWQGSTAASVRVPLGPSGARKLQHLVLGEGLGHHGLIVGRPGSGKSNLMHVIITTMALSYSPEEMQLYLIDFKKGVEFKPYADCKLPHALAIAVESEREFGFSVIERLDLELKERGDRFRAAGATSILEYRQNHPNERIPRVLLLIDEFQELFIEDDNLARQSALLLDRLVRQGRAFGLHVILGSQTLGSSHTMSRSTLDQMAIRIAMQCTEADSRLILADDNPAARLLSRPGEAIYNASTGTVEGNNLFQVAIFQEADRKKWLGTITQLGQRRGGTIPVPIIFEGNELAHAEDCRMLNELVGAPNWPGRSKSIDLFLGEPIAIRPPVAARIRRQSGSNLVILTREENEGAGMCVTALLSVLLQHRPEDARIFIADFTTADSEWAEHAEEIERSFPGEIKVVGRQRDVSSVLATIAEEMRTRGEDSSAKKTIYLVLQGMHRIKALREDEEDEDGKNAVELLGAILRDGPEVGIHVIAWADTWANATRGLGRKRFGEFGLRVGAMMSAEESMNFLDGPAASRLSKPHRAIFFDEDRPGQLVTFRPYAMASLARLKEIGNQLRARITIDIHAPAP